jgi:hypothetical protein
MKTEQIPFNKQLVYKLKIYVFAIFFAFIIPIYFLCKDLILYKNETESR